ncbi:hypothetical protein [Nocardia neocaledoniensis]|nr:hypothetical protein [Nocardia neocaledoniensis]
MRAGLVGAVMMPTALAVSVKNILDDRGAAPLPIIGHPRARMWSFLVRSDIRPIGDPTVLAALWKARIVVIRDGDIALPSPVPDPLMIRTWISPASNPIPSGTLILDTVVAHLPQQDRQ